MAKAAALKQSEPERRSTPIRARVFSISDVFASRARDLGVDDLGQPVRRLTAEGGEPCRDVLRRAAPGEQLILASHSPFAKEGPFKEYGPVYILDRAADEVIDAGSIVAGQEHNYLRERFAIRAYSKDETILDAALVDARDAQAVVDRFFARDDVAFLHVRFPTYGCFAARLERF